MSYRLKFVNKLEPFVMMSDAIDEVVGQQKRILVIAGNDTIAACLRTEMLNAWGTKKTAHSTDDVRIQSNYIRSGQGWLIVNTFRTGCGYAQDRIILYLPQNCERFNSELQCVFPMTSLGGKITVVTIDPEIINFWALIQLGRTRREGFRDLHEA